MPQYIKNPTTGETMTLEESPYKTLQEASDLGGFSPIAAPADELEAQQTEISQEQYMATPEGQAYMQAHPELTEISPEAPQTVTAAEATKQAWGEPLTLSGGQVISPEDPNYATYAKQMGITPPAQLESTWTQSNANKLLQQYLDADYNQTEAVNRVSELTGFTPQMATLSSPTGEKKVVAVGSQTASDLLSQGWTLGDKYTGDVITTETFQPTEEIDIGGGATVNDNLANQTTASIKAGISSTEELISHYKELLTPTGESELSKRVDKLIEQAGTAAGELTGRGAMQIAEEEKRDIEEKQQALMSKNTLLKQKLAEIDALTASYNEANQQEEGRPQTLSRLQGAQAQNYKMYLAQKNTLTAEASYMQAEILGLQGELEAAQVAADRAVDLEYADRQDEYNALISQLNLLTPQLDKEEARYAQAARLALEDEAMALAEQKEDDKAKESIALTILANGGDSSLANQIRSAPNIIEAAYLAGDLLASAGWKYVSTPAERDSLIKQGYEITQSGGRTYAKLPGMTELEEYEAKKQIEARYSTTGGGEFNFSSDDVGRLLNTGFNANDVAMIEKDINNYGVEAVIAGLPENQADAIRNIARGITPTQELAMQEKGRQFLNEDYFRSIYTEDQLKEEAKKAGFTAGGFLGFGVGEQGIQDYLDWVMSAINQYRTAGYTDEEIVNLMKK
jgi:hypothetical protein